MNYFSVLEHLRECFAPYTIVKIAVSEEEAKISEVQAKNQERLLNLPNVTGIGGAGYKVKGGKPTKDFCLIVYVEKKVPLSQLSQDDIIPVEIDGVKTDVIETGRLEAL